MSLSIREVRAYSPLTLAYIGDGVYELLVREYFVKKGNAPAGDLHRQVVSWVNASAQAKVIRAILPDLTKEEEEVWRRGRNAGSTPPKNADPADYHYATGFESLFGYLHLLGKTDRIDELFQKTVDTLAKPE